MFAKRILCANISVSCSNYTYDAVPIESFSCLHMYIYVYIPGCPVVKARFSPICSWYLFSFMKGTHSNLEFPSEQPDATCKGTGSKAERSEVAGNRNFSLKNCHFGDRHDGFRRNKSETSVAPTWCRREPIRAVCPRCRHWAKE